MEERRFIRASPRPALERLGVALVVAAANVVFERYGGWTKGREMIGPAADVIATGMLISLFFLVLGAIALLVLRGGIALDREGFTVMRLGARHHVRWSDISGFRVTRVVRTGVGRKMVGFSYVAGYEPTARLRAFNRAVSGIDAALPEMNGISVTELASLMEQWRQAHGPGSIASA